MILNSIRMINLIIATPLIFLNPTSALLDLADHSFKWLTQEKNACRLSTDTVVNVLAAATACQAQNGEGKAFRECIALQMGWIDATTGDFDFDKWVEDTAAEFVTSTGVDPGELEHRMKNCIGQDARKNLKFPRMWRCARNKCQDLHN